MKTFEYRGEEIAITEIAAGLFRIEGLETEVHTIRKEIYENCDCNDRDLRNEAKQAAYQLLWL